MSLILLFIAFNSSIKDLYFVFLEFKELISLFTLAISAFCVEINPSISVCFLFICVINTLVNIIKIIFIKIIAETALKSIVSVSLNFDLNEEKSIALFSFPLAFTVPFNFLEPISAVRACFS